MNSSLGLLVISLVATTLPAFSEPYPNDYGFNGNRKKAQEDGRFVRDLAIEPSQILWLSHKVHIYQSWLKRTQPGTYFALFRATVDGKHNSLPFKKDSKLVFLEFEPEPNSSNVYDAGRIRGVRWYTYLFGKDGPWVHFIRFNDVHSEPTEDIQLRVLTRIVPLENPRMINKPTDVVLTLKLGRE